MEEKFPFFFVEVDKDFRVRSGFEVMALFNQALAKLEIIINLAVEDNPNRTVLVAKRLTAALQVNDAQAAVSQSNVTFKLKSLPIGPTVD
jgi:hypothetical protein